jgi:hypothetical protein
MEKNLEWRGKSVGRQAVDIVVTVQEMNIASDEREIKSGRE